MEYRDAFNDMSNPPALLIRTTAADLEIIVPTKIGSGRGAVGKARHFDTGARDGV